MKNTFVTNGHESALVHQHTKLLGVILRAHPIRGELRIQHCAYRVVTTLLSLVIQSTIAFQQSH